jgi:hypothetical protein
MQVEYAEDGSLGGNFPSSQREGVNISCRVDGVRPVIFKIQRLEEK